MLLRNAQRSHTFCAAEVGSRGDVEWGSKVHVHTDGVRPLAACAAGCWLELCDLVRELGSTMQPDCAELNHSRNPTVFWPERADSLCVVLWR